MSCGCATSAASSSSTSSTWRSTSNREAVEEAFRQALARDKTRTQVFPISELGLVEMTRKRVSEGLVEVFSTTCPQCNGRGLHRRRVAARSRLQSAGSASAGSVVPGSD